MQFLTQRQLYYKNEKAEYRKEQNITKKTYNIRVVKYFPIFYYIIWYWGFGIFTFLYKHMNKINFILLGKYRKRKEFNFERY